MRNGCDKMLEIELVNNINNYLEDKGIKFSNELRMGIGIPDISLNIGASQYLKPINDYFLLSIFNFINKRKIVSFTEIKNEFLLTFNKVKYYLMKLADMSLVEIKNELVRIIKNISSTNLGITISIEAKLKDWKGAGLQAQRYLCFSDYSYIAMPCGYIKNIDTSFFEETGIGILSIDGKRIEEILPAKKSKECEFTLKYILTSKIVEKYGVIKKKHLKPNVFTPYVLSKNS